MKYSAMILECQGEGDKLEIITKAHGNVADKIGKFTFLYIHFSICTVIWLYLSGKPCETGMLAVVDPEARCIVLRLYEGLIKVVPLYPESVELTAYNIRYI